MYNIFRILVILASFSTTSLKAQFNEPTNPWIIGFGVNLINDSVEGGTGLFDFRERYHYHRPFYLSVEKKFSPLVGLNLGLNNNRFLEGKIVNNQIVQEDIKFFSVDLGLRLYLSNLWTNPYRTSYELFGTGGFGTSRYNNNGNAHIFAGPGLNIYLSHNWWLQGQALAKVTLQKTDNASNYLHFNIGVIYKFLDNDRCGCY